MTALASALLALLGLALGAHGLPGLRRALRDPEHPASPELLLRALRRLIVAAGLLAVAAGALSGQRWLLLFGLVFLAEEIVECSVHLGLAVRDGRLGSSPEG